jgi:hypothetical protein
MVMSPILTLLRSTFGAGATTARPGGAIPSRAEPEATFGGGPTTETGLRPLQRDVPWLTEGAGATTQSSLGGSVNCECLAAGRGIIGRAEFANAISGLPSPLSFMSGGLVTSRPRSGATAIMDFRLDEECARECRETSLELLPRAGKESGDALYPRYDAWSVSEYRGIGWSDG